MTLFWILFPPIQQKYFEKPHCRGLLMPIIETKGHILPNKRHQLLLAATYIPKRSLIVIFIVPVACIR